MSWKVSVRRPEWKRDNFSGKGEIKIIFKKKCPKLKLPCCRKGEVGDWRNHLTEEQVRIQLNMKIIDNTKKKVSQMAAWEEEGLAGSGFKFVHNL